MRQGTFPYYWIQLKKNIHCVKEKKIYVDYINHKRTINELYELGRNGFLSHYDSKESKIRLWKVVSNKK